MAGCRRYVKLDPTVDYTCKLWFILPLTQNMSKSDSLTIGELREELGGALTVESAEDGDDQNRVVDYDALIWTAHHRPPKNLALPLEDLNPRWRVLADFYMTREGQIVRDLGDIQGDLGATEISRGLLSRLRRSGFNPLWVYPSLGGRVGVDWNRAPGENNKMVVMPAEVQGVHRDINRLGIEVLYRIVDTMAARLRVVLQPHTMASGEFADSVDAVVNSLRNLDPTVQSYPDDLREAVRGMYLAYNEACNSGEPRPGVDLVVGYQDSEPLPDAALHARLETHFMALRIVGQRNKPFPHAKGYPGSELVERLVKRRTELGLPVVAQATFDIAKRNITSEGRFDALESVPDERKVTAIVEQVTAAVLSEMR